EVTIPERWDGRRTTLRAEYLQSFAAVFVDGKKTGEVRFPGGELDLSAVCRPGKTHVLSLLVVDLPLKGVQLSFSDTNAAREVKATVARRGLCGDVFLASTPSGPRIADVKVDPSVRKGAITFSTALEGLATDVPYALRVEILQDGLQQRIFTCNRFKAA